MSLFYRNQNPEVEITLNCTSCAFTSTAHARIDFEHMRIDERDLPDVKAFATWHTLYARLHPTEFLGSRDRFHNRFIPVIPDPLSDDQLMLEPVTVPYPPPST